MFEIYETIFFLYLGPSFQTLKLAVNSLSVLRYKHKVPAVQHIHRLSFGKSPRATINPEKIKQSQTSRLVKLKVQRIVKIEYAVFQPMNCDETSCFSQPQKSSNYNTYITPLTAMPWWLFFLIWQLGMLTYKILVAFFFYLSVRDVN